MKKTIAILCSDIHLSHKAPIARSGEPDWYEAMARPLGEVRNLQNQLEVPVICAGDIFDRWNSPPELINFAMDNLPWPMYCIPGNHDLPQHRYEDISKSAYWTLVRASTIQHIDKMERISEELDVYGFTIGQEILPCDEQKSEDLVRLAVVHSYIWKGEYGYPGASDTDRVLNYTTKLSSYDAAVFGDNHKGFLDKGDIDIFNCGTLMRRKSDEIHYRPWIGLLREDGTIDNHYLDTTEDIISKTPEIAGQEALTTDLEKFVEQLQSLGPDSLDYTSSVIRYMEDKGVDDNVKKIVLEAIDR